MTKGNKGVFSFKKITKSEVENQIRNVDNKESFGHDAISYGFLKKMSRWISGEMAEIMNLSLEIKRYPRIWKVARVKPLFKGEGCNRHEPKSYRPVALLSGISRIMEAILARQLDEFQENNKLIHPGVHGFRKSRGTNTAMMEVWEYVTRRTEKGELVALDFLDVSAGFDTLIHLYILRKMQVQFGMDEKSLEWLASYLKGWIQYTVMVASNSTPRKNSKGAPQGGGLSPIIWRSSTNDIPEAGVKKERPRRQVRAEQPENREQQDFDHEGQEDVRGGVLEARQHGLGREEEQNIEEASIGGGIICRMVDNIPKEELTTEEKLDIQMRREKIWKLDTWKSERTGGKFENDDRLKCKMVEGEMDVVTTIYADDTQSRAAARTLGELEKRNSKGLTRVCQELKAMRLKVNESKTVYMILATQGIRRRENLDNKESVIDVCGNQVKNVKVGKALGLLISDDLTWRHQTAKVVENCQEKMRGLWKVTTVLRKDQRKIKAEAIILSRLSYCLEVTSTGRKCDMEKLQGVQSAAARWVSQTRKLDWRLKKGLKKLGWLSMCQLAAYLSIKAAMKILRDKKPERLYESLTEKSDGEIKRKIVNEKKFIKIKMTTRKSWSYRSLRWLEKMPETLREKDPTRKATKIELKKWVRDQIPVRGCRIMWGKKLTGEVRRNRRDDQGAGAGGDGPGGEIAASKGQPATTPSEGEEEHRVERTRSLEAREDPNKEATNREVPAEAEEQHPPQSPERVDRGNLHQTLQSATIQAAKRRSFNRSSFKYGTQIDTLSKEMEQSRERMYSQPRVHSEEEGREGTNRAKNTRERQPAKPPWLTSQTILFMQIIHV